MADVKDNPIINYVAQAAQAHAADSQAKLDIQKQLDVQEQSSTDAMLAATRVGGSQATQVAAQESWKASSDAQIAAMGEKLGTSWTDQGSETNKWASRMKENAEKAYAAKDVIHEKQSKTLLNDPLGYIEAQFSLPSDIETHNYYAGKFNQAEQNLNQVINASNAAAISVKQMEKRTSVDFATAKAEEAMALAAGNVAQLKRQAAGDSIKGITEINNLNTKQVDLVFKVHSAQNADASLALHRQAQADNHKMALLRLEQRQEELATKAATEADWQAQMETRNVGARAKGVALLDSVAMFKREYAMQGKNPIYQNMLTYGSEIEMNKGSLSGVAIAQNAGTAARDYAATGGVNLQNNPVGSFLSGLYSAQKLHPTAPKDPIAFAATVDKVAIDTASTFLRSIDNSNSNAPNIYAAPAVGVMLKSASVLSSPFIVDTLVPMRELNPNVQVTDATMLAKAADYAKTGKANFNVAAEGIVNYYKQASNLNNANRLYKENGLPPQKDYMAKIDGRNVDLTSLVQVRQYIFKRNMQDNAGFLISGVPNTSDFVNNPGR